MSVGTKEFQITIKERVRYSSGFYGVKMQGRRVNVRKHDHIKLK